MSEHPKTNITHLFFRNNLDDFITVPTREVYLDRLGFTTGSANDKHRGHFLPANVRNDGFRRQGEKGQRARVFNHRQISIIDHASLDRIGDGLEIDPDVVKREFDETRFSFLARHIGANLVIDSIRGGEATTLNALDPPYHLGPFDSAGLYRASMLVISYNEPCVNPGKAIGEAYPGDNDGMGRRFKEVAHAHRGFVGVTSMEGRFSIGDAAMIVGLPKVPNETEA